MNADAFRQFYEYHFTLNRMIWDSYIMPLSQEQFTQPLDYSLGSVHKQIAHLINVDDSWFSDMLKVPDRVGLNPADSDDRALIRPHWDGVEQKMRGFLANLQDEMLFEKPLLHGAKEDHVLLLWQVLLHVVNHGTDHRAQLLRQLNDLGVKTSAQDFIFYIYDLHGV